MLLHEMPRVVLHEVAHEVLTQSRVIDERLAHEHLTGGKTLMVGYHPRFQIVVSHEIRHIGNSVLESLLAGEHRRACGVQRLYRRVQFPGSVHAFIVLVPSLTHFVSDAPDDNGRMVTVSQHHVSDVV